MKLSLFINLIIIWGVYSTELTETSFQEFIEKNERVMVMFYAPWCGHCNAMKPAYAEAEEELLKLEKPSHLAMVDATVHKELATKHEVQGYPTIKYFINGEGYKYEGGRSKDELVAFMTDPKPGIKPVSVTHVMVGITSNFTKIINSKPYVIVMFYAPWCGHCKQFLPVYDTSSNRLDKKNVDVLLVKVDATAETELAEKYSVSSYPTFKQFREGRPSEFDGPRGSTDEFTDYVIQHAGIATNLITEYSHVSNKISDEKPTIIGLFKDDQQTLYNRYVDQSSSIRDQFIFYHCFGEITDKFLVDYDKLQKGVQSILVIKPKRFTSNHEENYFVYTEDDKTNFVDFLNEKTIPLVGEFTPDTKKYMYEKIRPIVFVFMTVDWTRTLKKETQYWRNQILNTAKKFKNLATFVIADDTKMVEEISNFGFSDSPSDFNVGIITEGDIKYRLEEELDEWDDEIVSEFIEKYLEGKQTPYYRSQRAQSNAKNIVKVAVGSNFEDFIKSDKNVFIIAYAPWCGHCKELIPKFSKLAVDKKDVTDLVFMKIDLTKNDVPKEYNSDGFPTLYLKIKGESKPVTYDGKLEYEAMEEFLKKQLSI